MDSNAKTESNFDLVPDPRILPMLGEINLPQWRCVAELIDNSVDGFLGVGRAGGNISNAAVEISIPTADVPTARLTVRDNGPGMAADVLERAVKAGWTSNSPIGNLGLFGMGFNIATARLGIVTTVWTARKEQPEWHGLRIDFEQLLKQRHFRTPHLVRSKADNEEHGTEITIERLKPDQRAWLSKASNLSQIRARLSETYSAMLRANGIPTTFRLSVNGKQVSPWTHCAWDDTRTVQTARWGVVPAVMTVDRQLPDRPYCLACWQWIAAGDATCPSCGSAANVVQRKRRVHGWIGIQRFLSTADFGVDFLRNGRKIELANKDLFEWRDGSITETEYPIDDPRNRGRIVGEVHLDHCRVTYTKDRFERTDPAWEEMARIIRGEGPLRPDLAASAGYGANDTPLFKLYQAFRRSNPHNTKLAGAWAKVLVVKDNDRAAEMAKLFHKGESEFQSDKKWWDLVQEEDNKLLTPSVTTVTPTGSLLTGAGSSIPGFSAASPSTSPVSPGTAAVPPPPTVAPPVRVPIPSLTREYIHDETGFRWNVKAYSVQSTDPVFGSTSKWSPPWCMVRRTTGEDEFFVNSVHAVFRSATMTELDALISQIGWSAVDQGRGRAGMQTFASVLADLREKYAGTLKLDPVAIKAHADQIFSSIAKSWALGMEEKDCRSLFDEDLSQPQRDAIYQKMAVRAAASPDELVKKGRFLEYAPPRVLVEFVVKHPELFFDGKCWDDIYSGIAYPSDSATAEARSRLVRHYEALLLDAVWLLEQEAGDLSSASRERLVRGSLALDLLVPTSIEGAE